MLRFGTTVKLRNFPYVFTQFPATETAKIICAELDIPLPEFLEEEKLLLKGKKNSKPHGRLQIVYGRREMHINIPNCKKETLYKTYLGKRSKTAGQYEDTYDKKTSIGSKANPLHLVKQLFLK